MPEQGDFRQDPRMQLFISEITQHVGAQLQGLVQQSIAQLEKSISPAGRPVAVSRRREDGASETQHTTTPQLLAELNDRIRDLTDELYEANRLVRIQLKDAEPRARRRG